MAEVDTAPPQSAYRPAEGFFDELFALGHCHNVETWQNGRLVGGLYGVRLGAAFFGESMFSRERDASKVALVHLVARLKAGNFQLLDTQFTTAHLKQFGAIDVDRRQYHRLLEEAIAKRADFNALPRMATGEKAMEALTAATAKAAKGSPKPKRWPLG